MCLRRPRRNSARRILRGPARRAPVQAGKASTAAPVRTGAPRSREGGQRCAPWSAPGGHQRPRVEAACQVLSSEQISPAPASAFQALGGPGGAHARGGPSSLLRLQRQVLVSSGTAGTRCRAPGRRVLLAVRASPGSAGTPGHTERMPLSQPRTARRGTPRAELASAWPGGALEAAPRLEPSPQTGHSPIPAKSRTDGRRE